MGDRQQFSEGGSVTSKGVVQLGGWQHLGGLPFCLNKQYSLLAKTICFCPFCFLYQEKVLKLSHMWNHSLTLTYLCFLLDYFLTCQRGGTCPLGPYRLIAFCYQNVLFEGNTGWFLISVPCLGINNFLVFWSWRPEILHT